MSPGMQPAKRKRVKGVLAVRFGSHAPARRSACVLRQRSKGLGSSQWMQVIPARRFGLFLQSLLESV